MTEIVDSTKALLVPDPAQLATLQEWYAAVTTSDYFVYLAQLIANDVVTAGKWKASQPAPVGP